MRAFFKPLDRIPTDSRLSFEGNKEELGFRSEL